MRLSAVALLAAAAAPADAQRPNVWIFLTVKPPLPAVHRSVRLLSAGAAVIAFIVGRMLKVKDGKD